MSQPRQNYHADSETALNRQINLNLVASYTYLSMAYHFDRDDVALPGFHKFFKKLSDEKREHALQMTEYQNKRGGRVFLQEIAKPSKDEWGGAYEALLSGLDLEKKIHLSVLELHKTANIYNDYHFEDFLEDYFLKFQVEYVKKFSDIITNVKQAGPGLGEYLVDKQLCE